MTHQHLGATALLDVSHPSIQQLVTARGWPALTSTARIGAIYDFVRDEIGFGYNLSDDLSASAVLADGYGQCNTKSTLLMALLRATGIACRLHGGTVHKRLQKGVVEGIAYRIAPEEILHTWVEVHHDGAWRSLEGVILDARYLDGVREANPGASGAFLGFAVGTENIEWPANVWRGSDTFVQATGLVRDFGVFDDPDAFFAARGTNLGPVRAWVFRTFIRAAMNRRVTRIRDGAAASRTRVAVPGMAR